MLLNQEVKTVNEALSYLPSVMIRDQQVQGVSRPQSRGFQGSVVLNTRIDGMNIIGPTAYAAEDFSAIQVLNGPGGALYGPETPAGVFNYITKKPTDEQLVRYLESFDSNAVFTEQIDVGGHTAPDNKLGHRVNIVHGQGETYVQDSYTNRTMFSGDFDYHFDNKTVIEASVNHYETNVTGLQGSITYDGLSASSRATPTRCFRPRRTAARSSTPPSPAPARICGPTSVFSNSSKSSTTAGNSRLAVSTRTRFAASMA